MSVTTDKNRPPRQTLKNFTQMLSGGQFSEIFKVLRRRLINLLKFVRRIFLLIWFKFYDFPPLLKWRQKRQLAKILKRDFNVGAGATGKLNVGLVVRDGTTHPKSSAFIRLISPLTDPSVSQQVAIKLFAENTATVDDSIDIFIVQRTAYDNLDAAKLFADKVHINGKKFVLDTDDAFSLIDASHPEHHEQKQRIEALNYLLANADQIWVSTDRLIPFLPAAKSKPLVIENSLDNRLWQHADRPPETHQGPLKMVYMGTGTHSADLNMILPALDAVADQNPDSFKLTIIGIASELPERDWLQRRHVWRSKTVYPNFVRWFLKQSNYDIGLCPLVETNFNNSKSDIKCLDYLAADIVPAVSNVKPYQSKELDEFVIRVNNTTADWQQALGQLVADPAKTRQTNSQRLSQARSYLRQSRSSAATAKKLLELLKSLSN